MAEVRTYSTRSCICTCDDGTNIRANTKEIDKNEMYCLYRLVMSEEEKEKIKKVRESLEFARSVKRKERRRRIIHLQLDSDKEEEREKIRHDYMIHIERERETNC